MEQAVRIQSRQIRAARALLDWSQEDLAQATRLSIATIRKLELGFISPRLSTTGMVRQAFEGAGLEFIDYEGVRRRPEDMMIYQGAGGMASFLEDVARTAHRNTDGIAVTGFESFFAGDAFDFCGQLHRLANSHSAPVKCLLADALDLPAPQPHVEFRTLPKSYVDPIPFWVYGDKYAVIAADRAVPPKIVVIQSSAMASASRRHFLSMWEKGVGVRRGGVSG